MINSIYSSSSIVFVSNGGSTVPYINMSAPSSGMIRWNGLNNCMEVFDGGMNVWHRVEGASANISMSGESEEAIRWAIKKSQEEKELLKLAESNEAVRIALNNAEDARKQLELIAHLARENERLA